MKAIPEISQRTFWDVDMDEPDFMESYEYVINRVFDRGTLDEVYAVINYYGFDFVKKALQNTNDNLTNQAILLARAIFKLSYSDFICSKRKPFRLNY